MQTALTLKHHCKSYRQNLALTPMGTHLPPPASCGSLFVLQGVFPQTLRLHTEGFLRQELRPVLDQGAPSVPRLFSCKFSHKVALVTCPCACRLRRLARGTILGRHFSVNSGIKWLLGHVHVRFDCGGSHKTVVPALVLA